MKDIDQEKLMKVMTALDDATIISMLCAGDGCGAGCPGKYKLPQASCDFIKCTTCWKRALRSTKYPKGISYADR